MQKTFWFLFFLSLLMPSEVSAQTQDIHALSVVTRALEKAKKDNKIQRNTTTSIKNYRIENLNTEGIYESLEKQMTYKTYIKNKKNKKEHVEELVDIWPPKTEPATHPLDFNKLVDAFVSRFYFSLSEEKERIGDRTYLKINFWPREDLPPEKEKVDYILNRTVGVMYVDEETYSIWRISGQLRARISVLLFFNMERFDFNVDFRNWNGLWLISRMSATTKYHYWSWFKITRRFQTHIFWFDYGIE